MTKQMAVHFTQEDFAFIQEVAQIERRKPSDVIRNLLDDITSKKLDIAPPPAEKKHSTAVRMSDDLREQVEGYKKLTGLSADKALHLGIQKLRSQVMQAR